MFHYLLIPLINFLNSLSRREKASGTSETRSKVLKVGWSAPGGGLGHWVVVAGVVTRWSWQGS